ncbi:MAG: hypothetical protein IPH35_08010 [Rhodoferax sp.]|nr:hypothetical protein [Rhodoferax sp.]
MQSSLRLFKPKPSQAAQQCGFVMVTALIFLMVLSLLGVMAVRGSLFEERFSANDRDLMVARENAELALRDAERDILGLRFNSQPTALVYCAPAACTNVRPAGTRPANAADAGNFWSGSNPNVEDVARDDGGVGLAIGLQGVYSSASATACGRPVWSGADWQDGVPRTCAGTITTTVPTIPYGTFTDAPFAQQGVTAPRYLIELFRAGELGVNNGNSNKLFFRITAVGFGRTTGTGGARTSVTLQTTFSPL